MLLDRGRVRDAERLATVFKPSEEDLAPARSRVLEVLEALVGAGRMDDAERMADAFGMSGSLYAVTKRVETADLLRAL
jgi:hypothetical protein